jgi:hypothetical protein
MGIVSTEQFALTGMLYPISVPKASGAESLVGFIDADGSVVVEPSYALGSSFLKVKPASSISIESRDSSTVPAIRPSIPYNNPLLGRQGICIFLRGGENLFFLTSSFIG